MGSSPDGKNWTPGKLDKKAPTIWGVTFSGGSYYAVAREPNHFLSSKDGASWTTHNFTAESEDPQMKMNFYSVAVGEL